MMDEEEFIEKILQEINLQPDRDCGESISFLVHSEIKVKDCASVISKVIPDTDWIILNAEPMVEYGYTSSFVYWIETRRAELSDL